ncbi:DUF4407 domain-containing protein [Kordia jejudonensis]|uniref:DUF4407 domain-containing protein n=1 Tax=Kordia jejudonensis TaxID=1348245 RepID=UPI000629262B|nr:DUF4407 domain-containing protein [Kordia jejudonensis]
MNTLFYFLSKTNAALIKGCSKKAKYSQASMGMFVLFTGILAFISGTYALKMAFDYDTDSYTTAILGGLLYCAIIMAFDREIVAAKSKWAVVTRIPLAIMIGLIVSIPLELTILEGRINEQLADELKQKNAPNIEKIKEETDRLNVIEANIRRRISIQEAEIRKYDSIKNDQLTGSNGAVKGCGEICENAIKKSLEASEQLKKIKDEQNDFAKEKTTLIKEVKETYKIDSLSSQDLLSRYIALQRLKTANITSIPEKDHSDIIERANSTKIISWALAILIIFIEIFPALMKAFKEKTDYDELLEAQSEINRGLIFVKTDDILNDIEQNPKQVFPADAIEKIQKQMQVVSKNKTSP